MASASWQDTDDVDIANVVVFKQHAKALPVSRLLLVNTNPERTSTDFVMAWSFGLDLWQKLADVLLWAWLCCRMRAQRGCLHMGTSSSILAHPGTWQVAHARSTTHVNMWELNRFFNESKP